jgi:hypothetical protein
MSFTARRISTGAGNDTALDGLVHRRAEVSQLERIAKFAERARYAALAIERRARKEARLREARADAMRRARKMDADRAFVARAAALEEAYRLAQMSLAARVEETLDRVLAAALACIGAQISSAQRLRILLEQLAKEAGPVTAGRLCMCSADESIYRIAEIHSSWPIQIDDALPPGHVRLATDQAEWALDFETLVASLGSAPAAHAENNAATLPNVHGL